MKSRDTIAAVSSPAGRAARAIVRLSGPGALGIAARLFRPDPASLPTFRFADGELALERAGGAVPARLLLMRAPRSYTREDVIELHLPGSPVVAELALEAALAAGARLAEPGEFTRRAFESGRLSTEQAESVIDVIRARSRAELVAAAGQLSGRAGRELAAWRARAEELAARMEAELDYGEAPGQFLDDEAAQHELSALGHELDRLITRELSAEVDQQSAGGALRAVLAGATNAGKSLLWTRLTGRRALVSETAGTTRDVIHSPLAAAPRDVAVLDTAGLGAPPGEVELLARAAAERAWRMADILVLVIDRSDPAAAVPPELAALAREGEVPVVLALNKCDRPAAVATGGLLAALGVEPAAVAEVSALTGAGCAELSARLAALVREGAAERSTGGLASALRRREVLTRARSSLRSAADALEDGLGLACAADDLRDAARTVARHFEPGAGRAELDEAVINRIFARFCVGK